MSRGKARTKRNPGDVPIVARLDKLERDLATLNTDLEAASAVEDAGLGMKAIQKRGRELAAEFGKLAKAIETARRRAETHAETLGDADASADAVKQAFETLVEELDTFED